MVTTTDTAQTPSQVTEQSVIIREPYQMGWFTFLILWVVAYYGAAMVFMVADTLINQISLPRNIDLDIYIPLIWGFLAFFVQASVLNLFAKRTIEHWHMVGGLIWLVGITYIFAVATLNDIQLFFRLNSEFSHINLFLLYTPLVLALSIGQALVLRANDTRDAWVYGTLSIIGMGIYYLWHGPLAIHLSIFYPLLTGIGLVWVLRPERVASENETPTAIYETGNPLAFAASWLAIHTIIYGAGIYLLPTLRNILPAIPASIAITLCGTGLLVGLILAQKATLKRYLNQPLNNWLNINLAMLIVAVPLASIGVITLTRAQVNFFTAPLWTWIAIFTALFALPSIAQGFVLRRFVHRAWILPLLMSILALSMAFLSDATTAILGFAMGTPIAMFGTILIIISLFAPSNHKPLPVTEDTADTDSDATDIPQRNNPATETSPSANINMTEITENNSHEESEDDTV